MTIENLLATNVNTHIEKKANLSYLSWAWAWDYALRADPTATYKVETYEEVGQTGARRTVPYMSINGTCMVWVTVTIFGKQMTCQLPVMDHRNKAIPNPDAFQVNTAIMRCMTKALSLHGLGLYIYSGEDLPEPYEKEANKKANIEEDLKIPSRPKDEDLDLTPEALENVKELAKTIETMVEDGKAKEAVNYYKAAGMLEDMHIAFQNNISSKTRTALRKAQEEMKKNFGVLDPNEVRPITHTQDPEAELDNRWK
jgi:hypothetical protein